MRVFTQNAPFELQYPALVFLQYLVSTAKKVKCYATLQPVIEWIYRTMAAWKVSREGPIALTLRESLENRQKRGHVEGIINDITFHA